MNPCLLSSQLCLISWLALSVFMCINSHSFPLSFASVSINPVGVFPGVTPVCMVPYGLYANKQELGFFFSVYLACFLTLHLGPSPTFLTAISSMEVLTETKGVFTSALFSPFKSNSGSFVLIWPDLHSSASRGAVQQFVSGPFLNKNVSFMLTWSTHNLTWVPAACCKL